MSKQGETVATNCPASGWVADDIAIRQISWGLGGERLALTQGNQHIGVPWPVVRQLAYAMLSAAELHDQGGSIPELLP